MSGIKSIVIFLCCLCLVNGVRIWGTHEQGPGHLLDTFTDIYEATGTFPDDKDEYTQLSIVNRPRDLCLTVMDRKVGNGGRVGVDKCYLTNVETPELFWLRHAGDGYVALSTPWNKCVGAGQRQGAPLWTGDWCQEDIFRFALVPVSSRGVRLQNKATGRFMTAPEGAKQQATMMDDMPDDDRQLWYICNPSGNACWPSSPDKNSTKTTTTVTKTDVTSDFDHQFVNSTSDYDD